MHKGMTAGLILAAGVAVAQFGFAAPADAADAKKLRVISEKTAGGFVYPESCVYDPAAKVFYVSNFGGSALKPGEKDGNGRIAKVSLDGKIIENRFLPDTGDVLNKPKGLWPAKDGSLLIVGFKSDKEARGIFALTAKGEVKKLSKDIGRLDGLYQMRDGTLLATDWNTGFWFPSAFSVRSVVKAFRF